MFGLLKFFSFRVGFTRKPTRGPDGPLLGS
jgi:hypothetical protein